MAETTDGAEYSNGFTSDSYVGFSASSDDFANIHNEFVYEMTLDDCEADATGNFPTRRSTTLTHKLVEDIKKSISAFRPSSSLGLLASLTEDARGKLPTTEIDVIISGGGLKGYFMAGCSSVLLSELEKQNIKIARIAGASAGAWAGMFMLTNVNMGSWIETFHLCRARPKDTIHEVYEDITDWVLSEMPPNAYQICSGRLHISVTVITLTGVKNKIISHFTSNLDLIDCCLASSTLPYITERKGFRRLRGELVCDGGITNNCPVFPDGERRQLVFRLFDVEYPYRYIINPVDTCIDALVIRGALLMARFLDGDPVEGIAWLEKKEQKKDLKVKSNYYIRGLIIAPISVLGIIFFRGTGLSQLVDFASQAAKIIGLSAPEMGLVIPFNEAAKHFNPAPLTYIAGTLFATLVNALRALNLLL